MVFWVVAGVVLVVLLAIAWVSSGRAGAGAAYRHDAAQDRGQAEMHRTRNINGPPGPPHL